MAIFKYEAVIAKCRCLHGKLLKKKDYDNLLKLTSVSDIADYLRGRTAYAEFFGEAGLKNINGSKLEYYITKSLISDFVKICTFLSGNERRYVNLLLAKYELELILKLWRSFMWSNLKNNNISYIDEDSNETLNEAILGMQMIYRNNSKVDLSILSNVSNVEQLSDAIRGTDFFHIFEKYAIQSDMQNYTELEGAIYNEYYATLIGAAKAFDKYTQEKLLQMIFINTDLTNLERISRLLFYFHGSTEIIVPSLIPIRGRLKPGDIAYLTTLTNRNSFIEYCDRNLYYSKKQSFADYNSISKYLSDYIYKHCKSSVSRTHPGFDVVAKYFAIKDIERKNLLCLIEGLRYNMPPDQIMPHMTGLGNISERRDE